jgi:hypothetical protein
LGGRVAADAIGVNPTKVGKLIKSFRRKKPAKKTSISKAPKKKLKLKHPVSTEPVKIDRKEFAAKLRASGNRLDKTSLS